MEDRLAQLRQRDRELIELIIAAEAKSAPSETDDDFPTLDQEAYKLLSDAAKIAPARKPVTLKSLRREREIVVRAIELGSAQLGDLRAAWAAGELSSRHGDYRDMVKQIALAIASAQNVERQRQAFIQSYGAAGARSSLPCARFGLAIALGDKSTGPLHEFLSAVVAAGIVTKKELQDV